MALCHQKWLLVLHNKTLLAQISLQSFCLLFQIWIRRKYFFRGLHLIHWFQDCSQTAAQWGHLPHGDCGEGKKGSSSSVVESSGRGDYKVHHPHHSCGVQAYIMENHPY